MPTLDVGDQVHLTYDHKSPAGDLVNAGTMTVTITRDWDGTATTPVTVAPGSTGRYAYDYLTEQPGRHVARWVGVGANPGTYTEAFYVHPASPDYLISPDDARKALTSTDAAAAAMTAQDDELRLFVVGATGAVEKRLGEVLLRRTIVECHDLAHPQPRLVCRRGPAISLTSVATVDGARTWELAGLHLDPNTGTVTALSGPPFLGYLQLTYVAGYQVVPGNYVLAVRITLQHLWTTQRGSRGAPRAGGMGPVMPAGYALPNAASQLLPEPMSGFA